MDSTIGFQVRRVVAFGCAIAFMVTGCSKPPEEAALDLSNNSSSKHQHPELSTEVAVPVPSPFTFDDVTQRAGIKFTHFNSKRASLLPEDMGSGAAWGDYDQDGDEDLYVCNWAGPLLMPLKELRKRPGSQLYRNNGDGTFTEVSAQAGVSHVGWDMGCLWTDIENDGRLDLLVTGFTGATLYRNNGDGTFADITKRAGLEDLKGFCSGAACGDYDRDGDLDIYICRYLEFDLEKARNRPLVGGRPAVMTTPQNFPPQPNYLLRNNGDGTFEDATAITGAANAKGRSLQAVFCDFDNDGWPDIYVANDQSPDALFINKGDGKFENRALWVNTWDPRAGMGVAVEDFDADGAMDLFVTHWVGEDSAFYLNQFCRRKNIKPEERLVFLDVAPGFGLTGRDPGTVGWGTGFHDFDNDGRLDLFQVNGSSQEDELTLQVLTDPKLMPQKNFVYWNNGDGRFIDVTINSGSVFQTRRVGRGCAFADYDDDGKMDIFIVNHGSSPLLLRNVTPSGNWLKVKLAGRGSNPFGAGSRIRLQSGEENQSREIVVGRSYLSCDSLVAHFGLSDSAEVDSVEVDWPSGARQRLTHVKANQTLILKEPEKEGEKHED